MQKVSNVARTTASGVYRQMVIARSRRRQGSRRAGRASNFAPAEGGAGIRAGDAEGELVAGGHGGGDALNQLMIIGSLSFLTGL